MEKKNSNKIESIQIAGDLRVWFVVGIMFLLLFVFPIQIIEIVSNPDKLQQFSSPSVLGITTDNSGRFINIPFLGFPFDTELRDPSTLSFLFGSILFIIGLIALIIFFIDFRKKEKKYTT